MNIIQLTLDDMRGPIPPISPSNGCWIAGGAVRAWFDGKEDLSDIDVFAPNQPSIDAFVKALSNPNQVDDHKYATTFMVDGVRVQTMKIFSDTPQACVDKFDFNVCQFIWSENGIFATKEAIIGVLRGHLAVAKIGKEFAVDSLRRAFKYQSKGYAPCAGTIRDIAMSLRELTEEEIKSQVEQSPKGGKRIVRFD